MPNLLLLDKDGTLIRPKSGAQFVNKPWDQEPIAGVESAIARYVADGWTLAIISNQAGVAAGHKSLESAIQEMQFCLELFPAIEEAYFCPDFEGSECWRVWGNCDESHRINYTKDWLIVQLLGVADSFRKPDSGMLRLAIEQHSPDAVLFVGDRPEDEGAARAFGVPFQWADDWRLKA